MIRSYEVTEHAGAWVAGRPVKLGDTIDLSDAQARYELRLGTIRPLGPSRERKPEPEAQKEPDAPKAQDAPGTQVDDGKLAEIKSQLAENTAALASVVDDHGKQGSR
jgi:hypothetical protein